VTWSRARSMSSKDRLRSRRDLSAVRRRHRAGGYAWLFPKSPGWRTWPRPRGLEGDARNARQYLDAWIARAILGVPSDLYVGGVIAHTTIRQTYSTASWWRRRGPHDQPLSGGGIVNAMKAGRLAGRVATGRSGRRHECAAALGLPREWMAQLGTITSSIIGSSGRSRTWMISSSTPWPAPRTRSPGEADARSIFAHALVRTRS